MNSIRALRESDRADILEIAKNTWDGHDYVPYFFDKWLRDRNSHPVGMEFDGHVIAIANLRVIDNGRTGWIEKKLATIMTKYVVELAEGIPVERIRYTTAVDNTKSLHLAESVGMKIKFRLSFHWQRNPAAISWQSSQNPVIEVSSKELYDDLIASDLLPFNVLIYDWKAVDIAQDGLDIINSIARFWIQRDADKVRSFSVGSPCSQWSADESDQEWKATIYAFDSSSFLDQLSHHVHLAAESGCTSIFVTFDTSYSDTINTLDWVTKEEYEDEEWGLVLLERVF
jgi:hypothetical protein